jgi:hypothetical protein
VPLFAQTPVVGIPLSTPPLEDPPLEDPPLEDPPLEDPPLDELLEELFPLALAPLEEPLPDDPLPLAVVAPLEDPPPEELPTPGEPLLPVELVPLEEPAPDKPASATRGGLKSMLEVPEQPELKMNATAGNALSFALLIPLDFKQRTSLSSTANKPGNDDRLSPPDGTSFLVHRGQKTSVGSARTRREPCLRPASSDVRACFKNRPGSAGGDMKWSARSRRVRIE